MISDPLLQETDRCVKCGLCLPHCPTYLKLSHEADSPRGRIALIEAFVTEQLPLTKNLIKHLDLCLGCRACENVCPSGVAFGSLIDGARARIHTEAKTLDRYLKPRLLGIISDRVKLQRYLRLLLPLRSSYLLSISQRIAPAKIKRLLKVAELLPGNGSGSITGLYPAKKPSGKSLQLFIGCVSSSTDQSVISAATQLLTRLGYAVDIPSKQACCGALHRHNGFPKEAQRLCDVNRKQTQNSRAEALITLATACHLELVEHKASRLPVETITDFLFNHFHSALSITQFEPLSARVAVHIPCSARKDQTSDLLTLIPQLKVITLPENNLCCGAAGSYLLTQPELSNELGRDKLAHLRSTKPDILVTTNTGCAIQFRLQIQQAKLKIEVLHPVELINRQMRNNGFQA